MIVEVCAPRTVHGIDPSEVSSPSPAAAHPRDDRSIVEMLSLAKRGARTSGVKCWRFQESHMSEVDPEQRGVRPSRELGTTQDRAVTSPAGALKKPTV